MSRGKYLAISVERKREPYFFAVLVLWLPILLCSQFLTDGGQSHITRAVIPAALLHMQTRHKQGREHTAVQHIQTEAIRWQREAITLR